MLLRQMNGQWYVTDIFLEDILRRAEKRGKELPEVLRIALERQANG